MPDDAKQQLPKHLRRNDEEIEAIRAIAESGKDRAVLMLNVNRYTPEAGYPDGENYRRYLCGLTSLVERMGGKLLWRLPVLGQPVGRQAAADEILEIWFPSHQAYLGLPAAPGGEENYRLRRICVEHAVIHRCPGENLPHVPASLSRP